jgi:hypothetical protein
MASWIRQKAEQKGSSEQSKASCKEKSGQVRSGPSRLVCCCLLVLCHTAIVHLCCACHGWWLGESEDDDACSNSNATLFSFLPFEFDIGLYLRFGKWWNIKF